MMSRWFKPIARFRLILVYGVALAGIAFLLEWLEYRQAMRVHSSDFYVVAIAVLFAALGIWVGHRLTPAARDSAFVPNVRALDTLGISARERDVLVLIAGGNSNKSIARCLAISPNTVKTHVANLYEKLNVASRTQAVRKAQALDILP
jgi:DNA-binding CsgD family transcriptional regulator